MRQRKHREVGSVDCGGVHFPHRGAWVTAEVAGTNLGSHEARMEYQVTVTSAVG